MEEGYPSAEELKALRVVDLRMKLSEAGLPQGGVKVDLIQRLSKHYSKLAQEKEETEVQEKENNQEELNEEEVEPVLEEPGDSAPKETNGNSEDSSSLPSNGDSLPTEQEEEEHPQKVEEEHSQQEEEHIQKEEEHPQKEEEQLHKEEEIPQNKEEHPQNKEVHSQKEEEIPQNKEEDSQKEEEIPQNKEEHSLKEEEHPQKEDNQLPGQDDVPLSESVPPKEAADPPNGGSPRLQEPPPPKVFAGAKLPAFEAGPLQVPPPAEEETHLENTLKEATTPVDGSLPQALEEAFAFKKERVLESGCTEEDSVVVPPRGKPPNEEVHDAEEESSDRGNEAAGKQQRGKKKKKKRRNRPLEWAREAQREALRKQAEENGDGDPHVEIEYIHEKLDADLLCDPKYRGYVKVFEAFKIRGKEELDRSNEEREKEIQKKLRDEFKKVPKLLEEDDLINEADEDDDDIPKLSKRKLKKLNRLSVAELKQLVDRPDVVEMHDVTAWDPRLLVHLKSTRNSVPVPRHWCFKRKYLQGKRGIEKPPFDLPEFIKKTGIMEMRAALQEKEESKGLKSKMREKVRPKLGKIDIDYQKLHDAFFKWQTKPRMTGHGDLYYEGKEFEIRLKEKKPGDLSDDLRTALGMPVGPNAHKVPPPWLIAMQRYGPPPSYPNLKIPGLNAPIPEGCTFGYHAGGWGKPPVDETGKPLYGDVFGTSDTAYAASLPPEEIDRSLWGEMESESEEEDEEESEEEGEPVEDGEEAVAGGLQTPVVDAGLATPSGMSSVGILGGETPELLELRKRRIEADMESAETPNLYTVIPEKRNERIGSSMMGSTHSYDLTGQGVKATTGKGPMETLPVELALNPEEVDLMDTEAMQIRAEAAIKEQQASLAKEDFSDMVAEHAAKQSNKRKRLAAKDEGSKASKKYKEFKF